MNGPDPEASLAAVRARVEAACERAGRDPAGVRLVGASKFVPAEMVRAVSAFGLRDFAENYAKELRSKRAEVPDVTWHYVGALQAGTARVVADCADVVHSLEPGAAVQRLAARAAREGRRIPALIQVDFTGRREGTPPEDIEAFAEETADLEGIDLRGLMTLPPQGERAEDARPWFVRLRELRDSLSERLPQVEELSMGMSLDYEIAVEEGATMIRVGTALFGRRPDVQAR